MATDNKPDFSRFPAHRPGLCNPLALAPRLDVVARTESGTDAHRPRLIVSLGPSAHVPHLSGGCTLHQHTHARAHTRTNTHARSVITGCSGWIRDHTTSAQCCFDASVLFFQVHTLMPALYIVSTHTHTLSHTRTHAQSSRADQTCVSSAPTVFKKRWN